MIHPFHMTFGPNPDDVRKRWWTYVAASIRGAGKIAMCYSLQSKYILKTRNVHLLILSHLVLENSPHPTLPLCSGIERSTNTDRSGSFRVAQKASGTADCGHCGRESVREACGVVVERKRSCVSCTSRKRNQTIQTSGHTYTSICCVMTRSLWVHFRSCWMRVLSVIDHYRMHGLSTV
jgi:hypothetical protein